MNKITNRKIRMNETLILVQPKLKIYQKSLLSSLFYHIHIKILTIHARHRLSKVVRHLTQPRQQPRHLQQRIQPVHDLHVRLANLPNEAQL
jgi:hypothetical protein